MIPSTGKIDRLLVELRPRLQCANFFISFPRKFVDIESTTIELATDRITIVMKGERERYEIRTGDYFQLHTQTLSSLVIKNRYICFRVNTNESVFGSERLSTGQEMPGSDQHEENFRLACNVQPGQRYRVLCSNCAGPLQQSADPAGDPDTSFQRVLELPSEQLDTDDWFCHRHDHQPSEGAPEPCHGRQQGEPSSQLSTKFEPQPGDLFYGTFYALLHRNVLQRVHVRNDRFVYCKRCLQYLGSTRKNRTSVKLWYENVRFQPSERSAIPLSLFRTDDALELFHHLVRKTVREFNFVTHLGLPPSIKLLFELRRPGMQGDVFYLLMQIMDCQLSVFRAKQKRTGSGSSESCSDDVDDCRADGKEDVAENVALERVDLKKIEHQDEANHDDDEGDDDDDDVFIDHSYRKHTIKLERHRAMKLMYQYEKYDDQPLFVFWREDSNVVNLELSEPMFSAAIRYLDANSSYVPECYRVNLGFSMSYLDIQ
uniref:E3 ubiquitin-protein ligase E3D n=1 Tax=Anopheles coluzzii TaxID=1518534 RepID=A0A8W7P9U2_ANOCL